MSIDEKAYQQALAMNKGKTFSEEGGADECFRYFASCYEAAKASEQPEEHGAENRTVARESGASRTARNGESIAYEETDRTAARADEQPDACSAAFNRWFEGYLKKNGIVTPSPEEVWQGCWEARPIALESAQPMEWTAALDCAIQRVNEDKPVHEHVRMSDAVDLIMWHDKLRQPVRESIDVILNPRRWTQEMHEVWHKAIPDLHAAFAALRAIYEQGRRGRDD